jgi:multimeric flavodoxin WrbA
MGIPGQLKCFIDRLGNSVDAPYSPPPKRLKVYGAIAQGSDLFSGQENAITQIINHALIMGGVVVSGDIPQSYIGAGGWTERNVKLDAIESSHERGGLDANVAIKASMSVGKRVAELALIIRAGVIHYAEYLDRDPVYRPLMERLKPS